MGSKYDNEAILDVKMDELSEEDQKIITDGIKEFEKKCLLCFTKTRGRDAKIIQKTDLPTVLLDGHVPKATIEDKEVFEEIMYKILAETVHNHISAFLKTFWNIMAAFYGPENIPQFGKPEAHVYFDVPPKITTNAEASGPGSRGPEGNTSTIGVGNAQNNTTNKGNYVHQSAIHTGALNPEEQQPPTGNYYGDYHGMSGRIPGSAQKISGSATRLARDEIPGGYHHAINYRKYAGVPRPGYEYGYTQAP